MSHNVHLQKRKEKFYKLAKEQGYRSRAAYKLIQLNKKFSFLNGARAAIDLCAAPGGWLQILSKYMPVSSMIIGVDILPIKPLPNVIAFQQDITTAACRQQLRKHLQGWQVDLVVHDGAPNVGGGSSWVKDSYVQNELVLCALKLACEFLVEDGTFVTKIFRSDDYMALTWVLKQFFKKVEVTKPLASREQSSEVFAVCTGYLAPKKIDPRIFEPNVVFKMHQEQQTTSKVMNVLQAAGKKAKNNRSGYADDVSIVQHKTATITEFLNTTNPSNVLAVVNEIVWEAPNGEDLTWIKQHPLTDTELFELCKDLKVLSKGDFSRLIKWHKKLRDYKQQLDNAGGEDLVQEELIELTPEQLKENQEQALDAELDALQERIAGRKKREQKKLHEKKMKELQRLAVNANNMAERLPTDNDDALFNLSAFKTSDDVKLFKKAAKDLSKVGVEENDFHKIITTKPTDMDSDLSDIEEKIYDEMEPEKWAELSYAEQREKMVDLMYNRYKERKGIVTKRDKKAQAKLGADDGDKIGAADEDNDTDNENRVDEDKLLKKKFSMNDDTDSDDDDKKKRNKKAKKATSVDEVQDYLKKTHQTSNLLKKGEKETNLDQASRWFSQGIFEDIDIDNDEERKMYLKHQKKLEKLRQQKQSTLELKRQQYYNDNSDADVDSDSDNDRDSDKQQLSKKNQNLPNTKKRKISQVSKNSDDDTEDDDNSDIEVVSADKKQNKNKKQRKGLDDKKDDDDYDYNSIVNQDDSSDWHSSDEDTSTDDDNDSDSDAGYDETFGSAHHGRGRWHGSAYDKDRELQKKIDMDAKAKEYIFKTETLNKAEMEVAPAAQELSEYSDDSDARAEIIALGKKMLRKKGKEQLVEATYNKYTWNDRDDLPEWFIEDESQHNVPQIPITRQEVLAVKAHFKAIDARPIHKIAEAKARKKKGEIRKLERQKIHAENIMEQDGVSTEQKMRQLQKLTSKKGKTEKVVKQYVMAEKSGKVQQSRLSKDQRGKKTWTVRVDRRMKRDKIGARRAEWRKKNGPRKEK